MELNKSQAILLAYIQNQQQRAGKRLVREREVPRDIVTSFGLLQLELRREGVVMSEAEAIGTLQQLVGMDMGDNAVIGGNGKVYDIDGKDTWVEYGLGANFNLTDSTYVWADVERTSGGYLDEDWRATVGVRHAF